MNGLVCVILLQIAVPSMADVCLCCVCQDDIEIVLEPGQEFIDTYIDKWPGITRSTVGIHYAKCNACNTDFSIKYGGSNDITKHVCRTKHARNLECINGVAKIETYIKAPAASEIEVTNAECLMTNFIIEHNFPVSS